MQKHTDNWLKSRNKTPGDRFICEWCNWREGVDVHHVDGRDIPNPHKASNLILLCRICHEKFHDANTENVKELVRNVVKDILSKVSPYKTLGRLT